MAEDVAKGKVGASGRITIPVAVRKVMKLKAGDSLVYVLDDHRIYLERGGKRRKAKVATRKVKTPRSAKAAPRVRRKRREIDVPRLEKMIDER